MSVRFARPNVSELAFHFYGRSVHPELFQIYAEAEIYQETYAALIRICEAGHTVSIRSQQQTFTEVATTRQHSLPQRKRLLEKRLRGCRDESFQLDNGIRYHVSYQLERVDPPVFLNLHEELLADCSRVALSHCFPPCSRLAPGPISLIRTEAVAESLLIHAFHTFPEECAIVKTQSLYEF